MISSPTNERVKYVRSLNDGRVRQRERAFVIEGVRLVGEALRAGIAPSLVIIDGEALERTPRGRELLGALRPFHPLQATEQVLRAATQTMTPQGVVAVVPLPLPTSLDSSGPLMVLLESVGDPGNVGTILRTAWASGIVRTVVGLQSADFHSPKVVRSAAGAHFHLQLLVVPDWPSLRQQLPDHKLLVAVAAGGTPYLELRWDEPSLLVIGSEARGVRSEIVAAANSLVHIPMPGHAESLNAAVAAGILIFAAVRHMASFHTA